MSKANSKKVRGLRALVVGAAAALGLMLAQAAAAQQLSPGALVWADGGCSICHNSIGQAGTTGEAPPGPNLWRSRLTKEQLKETISCGRENTQMPYHLIGAFTTRACWGRPAGKVPDNAAGGAELTEQQIDTLVDFLVTNVVGKAPINKEKCALFFGGNQANPTCASFPN